jgi:glycosyltransferase involved in cell wall biosynthesis
MAGKVWQLVPVLEEGDAIGDHARRMASILGPRHGGFIVERVAPSLRKLTTHLSNIASRDVDPEDILVYHVALASQLGTWLRTVRCRTVIDYHGITPASFLRAYDPGLSVALSRSVGELESLRPQTLMALADSDYLRAELVAAGYRRTETLPILLDFSRFDVTPDPARMARLADGKRGRGDVLFVGRVAPNKRHEDLVKAFVLYRRLYNPGARLFLVGRPDVKKYFAALSAFVERLGVEGIHVVGRVSPEELVAYYHSCDVFLSMSEHEGFGIPWLEAMYLGMPVVTYRSAALGETVAGGGLLFDHKDWEQVAALLDLVVRDDGMRARLIDAGRRRVAQLRPERFEARVVDLMDQIGRMDPSDPVDPAGSADPPGEPAGPALDEAVGAP